jgi:hypothetical protein
MMFNQYGSILCISCESSMRLATIEPGEAGTSTATFESGIRHALGPGLW